jgi:hypothetical protein
MLVTDLSAGCETLLLVISECDRPCNRRLARARQAAQLEEVSLIWPVHPAVYLVEELDARVGEAGRRVLLGVRVEDRVFDVL